MKYSIFLALFMVAVFISGASWGYFSAVISSNSDYCNRNMHWLSDDEGDQMMFKDFGAFSCEHCGVVVEVAR